MGYIDDDELIARRNKISNLFGTSFDSKTNQYVSFPSVPNAIEISSNITDSKESTPNTQEKTNNKKEFSQLVRWVVEGDHLPVINILKQNGFLYDPFERCWYNLKKPELNLKGIVFIKKPYKRRN